MGQKDLSAAKTARAVLVAGQAAFFFEKGKKPEVSVSAKRDQRRRDNRYVHLRRVSKMNRVLPVECLGQVRWKAGKGEKVAGRQRCKPPICPCFREAELWEKEKALREYCDSSGTTLALPRPQASPASP
ncbi:hypothetical protein HPP92_029127 [Vanilla planifolia]|uniref:Uncharacterized protein n=1 Tax=Vanilla planifolia TaxID=51239 RepID=A0A835P6L9_VANPL|nr:hypothetical protein HPP92_029127 [Vanilla planifolia]KAG0445883.1 hypothetical protein HPP92_029115 [Vanilla planifolia]